ncbi:MAG: cytochrome P450 [Myxococcota bacterium]
MTAPSAGVASAPAAGGVARTGGGLRDLAALWSDPVGFFARLAREQGDFASVRFAWQPLHLVSHPDLVSELMVTHQARVAKGAPLEKARVLLGNGLLTSDGELHRRQQRLIRPAFGRRRVAGYVDGMVRTAEDVQSGWRDGASVDAAAEMMRLAQRVVAGSLFGVDVADAQARAVGRALDTLVEDFAFLLLPLAPLRLGLPLPRSRRLRRAIRTLDEVVYAMINARRASGDGEGVLGSLLAARDEDGRGMDRRQIRDEAMTLFLAGHDTTGNSLAWSWYLLSQHPEVERRWHAELDDVLGDRAPTAEDVPRLVYTRRLFAESMRLYPPVPATGRRVKEPLELGGRPVARGAIVEVCQWVLHRDPRFFPEPGRFRPERWTPAFEQSLPAGAYIPFGLGPRHCIGRPFAWMAGVVLLATLGRRWRLRAAPDCSAAFLPRSITLRPRHGLSMRVRRR